jgi:hypothetical protein
MNYFADLDLYLIRESNETLRSCRGRRGSCLGARAARYRCFVGRGPRDSGSECAGGDRAW